MTVSRSEPTVTRATWCAVCGRPSGVFWRGWQARRSIYVEADGQPLLVFACPKCVRRGYSRATRWDRRV
jgi:hypothetical protein